jgi:Spy/CpxP family protein refolding chaperone
VNGTRGLIIATAAAFIVGCSVGLMGGILFVRFVAPGLHGAPMLRAMRGEHTPFFGRPGDLRRLGMRGGPDRMLSALADELDLSPAQRQRIVASLDCARERHEAMAESLHVWIERELTPEQRARWRELEERFERSHRRRMPRGMGPPDRP